MLSNVQVVSAAEKNSYPTSSDGLGIDLRWVPEFNEVPRLVVIGVHNSLLRVIEREGKLGDLMLLRGALPNKNIKQVCDHFGVAIEQAVRTGVRADILVFDFMRFVQASMRFRSLGSRGLARLLTPVSVDDRCRSLNDAICDFLGERLGGRALTLTDAFCLVGPSRVVSGREALISALGEALLAGVVADVDVSIIVEVIREVVVQNG